MTPLMPVLAVACAASTQTPVSNRRNRKSRMELLIDEATLKTLDREPKGDKERSLQHGRPS